MKNKQIENDGYKTITHVHADGEDEKEKKLREFLKRETITVRHARGIILGCGGAGKTTLLRRLANAKYEDITDIEQTCLLDVHVNKFVLTKENKMIPSNFFKYFFFQNKNIMLYKENRSPKSPTRSFLQSVIIPS